MNNTEITLTFDSFRWNYGFTGFLLELSTTDSNSECGVRNIYIGSDEEIVTLTTPGYPMPYRNDLVCEWIVRSAGERIIILDIIDFDMENRYDFLIVGNGQNSAIESSTIAKLTGQVKLRTLVSNEAQMWLKVASDRTGTGRGFQIDLTRTIDVEDICKLDDFDCGGGICVDSSAECDGFNDCMNLAEETHCAYITCPGSYLCDDADSVDIRMCVPMEDVCDGQTQCPAGDDETECDTKRCPRNCDCLYDLEGNLVVRCNHGWKKETLKNTPLLSYSLELHGNNLSSLESGDFKGLTNLRTLSLSRNGLTELKQRTFDGLDNLVWL
ncbi:low-density lipoprotein receptor-related protein 12-like [Amphiura filiformis]|uniref:low-density lipoprotein receptor-related protein 12-like n=1 Tax=Amphiura filiformis TaxID=82378 RepID=UPI003B20ED55